jgi:hypothetical protein
MKRWLLIFIIVLIGIGAYVYFNPQPAQAPVQNNSSQQTQSSNSASASTSTTLPPNVGATQDSNPNAPAGTAEECAKCSEYTGAQKAECLVSLNCQ